MAKKTKEDWQPWNDERERFKARETQGLEKDMAALKEHIDKLLSLAPKDGAGWPNIMCLDIINLLRHDLWKAQMFIKQEPN